MKWLRDNLILVVVISLLLIGLIWELILSDLFQATTEVAPQDLIIHDTPSIPFESSHENDTQTMYEQLYVDIKGEIHQPGVYLVDTDDRVIDVIESAGGLTPEADEKQINLAEKVYDEMVIYVPNQSEETPLALPSDPKHDKISINQASQAELEQLPGIGASKALAILHYREENGPLKAAEELKNISGIGEMTFEKLEPLITVP